MSEEYRVASSALVDRPSAIAGNLIEALPVALFAIDAGGHVHYRNAAAATLWGGGSGVGRLLAADGSLLPPDHHFGRGEEALAERADGTRVSVLCYGAGVDLGVRAGRGQVVLAVSLGDAEDVEARLVAASGQDPLTRLISRDRFQILADEALAAAQATGTRLAIMMIDIDDFKQINDMLGHGMGDSMLRRFSERLTDVVRGTDILARHGADEFALLLPDVDGMDDLREAITSIAERIREPFNVDGRLIDCRASIGAALYPRHGSTAEELMRHADIALNVAKGINRGGYRIFEPDMREGIEMRAAMVARARDALSRDRIHPFYQPKVALQTGKLAGFEALLRWRNARGGIQSPSAIQAAFEHPDVAGEISERMMRSVVADMRRWLDEGVDFGRIAINASSAEFLRDDLAERVLATLEVAGVPADRLELEVTETVFFGRGTDYVERALKTLSAAGVNIALDDFGTGFASLSHLKQFPVDVIKIDRGFVSNVEHNTDDAAIVGAVLRLGRQLGLTVVAEGIETIRQATQLASQGCEFGQGYLFAKAMPSRKLPDFIGDWSPRSFIRR